MVRKSFLNQIFALILIIAFLHITATIFHLYWSMWWYDLLVHFLGGFWVSLAGLWFVFFSGYTPLKVRKPFDIIATALVVSFSFGVLWELFEYVVGRDLIALNYVSDTSIDLVMDMAGALSGYLYFYFSKYERTLLDVN